jgi:hypothetical protein
MSHGSHRFHLARLPHVPHHPRLPQAPHARSRSSLAVSAAVVLVLGGSLSSVTRAQAPAPSRPGTAPGHPLAPPLGSPRTPPLKMPLQLPAKPARPAASVAASPPPAPPVAARVAPELESLRFLMGRWRCDGKQFASATFGPEHAFKATAENKSTVDGAWDEFLYEEKASKEHVGVKVHGLWGWEAASRRLIRATVSSDGTWDSATSPGLEGDKVVWTGDFSTTTLGKLPFRHTFTRKSDKEWMHALEMKDAAGRWSATSEVICKR